MKKLLVSVLLILAGCSSGIRSVNKDNQFYEMPTTTLPEMRASQMYLSVIYDEYPNVRILGDEFFLDLGYLLCDQIDLGMTAIELALLSVDYDIDAVLLGFVTGAAITTFCPWNSDFFG
jgi:hypothetical protein